MIHRDPDTAVECVVTPTGRYLIVPNVLGFNPVEQIDQYLSQGVGNITELDALLDARSVYVAVEEARPDLRRCLHCGDVVQQMENTIFRWWVHSYRGIRRCWAGSNIMAADMTATPREKTK